MDLKCDDIKKYVVKIKYNEELGSGIIVKPNNTSNICYVLTAKHTFDGSIINKEKITICRHNGYQFQNIFCDDLIEVDDIYDLVILFLDVKKNNLEHIDKMSILNHEFKDCLVVGYPNVGDGEIKCYKCEHDKTSDDDDKASYQVLSYQSFQTFECEEVKNIGGLSGGGVFTKGSDDKYYLVGIETEIRLPQNFLCLDFREIAEKINELLPEKIGLEGYSFSKEIGINPQFLDFDKLKSELNNDCIDKIKNKESSEQLKYIRDNNSDFKNFHQDTQSAIKVIAATYLYRSILFHEYGDNRRATNNFKKAIEYNPSYTVYFQKAKSEREPSAKNTKELPSSDNESLEQREKRCKSALETETVAEDNDSKLILLNELKSILSEKLTFVSDKAEKLKIYDELININLSILNIYLNDKKNDNNHFKQAKSYYDLAVLSIYIGEYDKEKYQDAKYYVQKILKLSSNHTALKAHAYRIHAYINTKQSLFKEAVKYYQKALVLYKYLQNKNNDYTVYVINILNDLAVVTDKLDKEDVIDVKKYYHDIYQQLKLLDTDSEIYHKLRLRTKDNLKKHREKISDLGQLKKLTEEIANQRYLSNNILKTVSLLDNRLNDLNNSLNPIKTHLNNKQTTKNSKLFHFIKKIFKE